MITTEFGLVVACRMCTAIGYSRDKDGIFRCNGCRLAVTSVEYALDTGVAGPDELSGEDEAD